MDTYSISIITIHLVMFIVNIGGNSINSITMDFIKSTLVLLLIYVYNTNCFNLDISLPIIKQGSPDSKFGFSLVQSNFKLPERFIKVFFCQFNFPRI